MGVDTSEHILTRAREMGAIDEAVTDLRNGRRGRGQYHFGCARQRQLRCLLETLPPLVRPDALITDIGSVKRTIVETGERLFGNRFVGGHPMAGAPGGGIDAARADVFTDAAWGIVGAEEPDIQRKQMGGETGGNGAGSGSAARSARQQTA